MKRLSTQHARLPTPQQPLICIRWHTPHRSGTSCGLPQARRAQPNSAQAAILPSVMR